jgi:hypothetical protein
VFAGINKEATSVSVVVPVTATVLTSETLNGIAERFAFKSRAA